MLVSGRGRLVLPKRIIKKVLQSQRKDVNVLSSNSTRPDAGTILLTPCFRSSMGARSTNTWQKQLMVRES
ncbi:hypothetical protein ACOSQ4_008085 [Xanthoceras sorbifolium]